jgi:flagellar assembly factor FliW
MSSAVMAPPQESTVIESAFGRLDVPAEALMHFAAPMWGFERHREFALLPAARKGLWWFISTADTPTTFILADPFVAQDGYGIDLNDSERDQLALHDVNDALALVVVAMPAAPGEAVTANFRAPLVFNVAERRVMQVVNRDDRQQLNAVIDLAKYPAQDGGVRLD